MGEEKEMAVHFSVALSGHVDGFGQAISRIHTDNMRARE
jgi:hypothetical protein